MSKLIVDVCEIRHIGPHPNPEVERLKAATIKGWSSCIKYDPATGKTQFNVGDRCIYVPPDAVLPPALIDRLGVQNYVAPLPKDPVTGIAPPGGRVRAIRLKGYPSYGLIMPIDPTYGDDPNWPVGTDVAAHFGITKWEPPPCTDPDAAPRHPLFHTYTDIQCWGNFPGAFREGEEGVITEKMHGKNRRQGYVLSGDDTAQAPWEYMIGSHDTPRREVGTDGRRSIFWDARSPKMDRLLCYLRDEYPWDGEKCSVLVFDELIGTQDMKYGLANGVRDSRAFEIAINGRYLDFDAKTALFRDFGVAQAPILYRGPISAAVVEYYTNGPTTLCDTSVAGKFSGREGIVVTPVVERFSPELCDRLILKSISVDYLARKGGTDSH